MAKQRMKKVTVVVSEDLLRRAMRNSRQGFAPTMRMALEALVAQDLATRRLLAEANMGSGKGQGENGGE